MRKHEKKQVWKAVGALLLSAVLALSAPISHLPAGLDVYAAEAQADENGFVIKDGVLTSYNGTAAVVVVPSSVTSIGNYAFYGCYGLTGISIPPSVTSIGNSAFSYCGDLMSITIPSSVTSIGDSAFSYCSSLTSIVVEEGNTSYDSRNNCNAIIESSSNILIAGCKNTVIPEGVASIGEYAFYGSSGLTSISIPSSMTSIGDSAFYGCHGLTGISIPSSVTSIGKYAFSYCGSVTSIVVEEGNEKYDSRNNCNAIIESSGNTLIKGCEDTVIPEGVTSIENYAFSGCSGLTSIELPSSVTSIGDWAFSGCSGLTSVTIPSSVTSIGNNAFSGCRGLTSISIPSSVTSIGNYAFSGCRGLTSISIPNSVTSIEWYAFYECSGLTSISIPSSVTSIGNSAFSGCSGLASISIPSSVTSIGNSAFWSCSGLTSIVVEEGNEKYDSRDNCNSIVESNSNKLIIGCKNTVIPSSVTSIEGYAFSGCSGLTSISIPNSVTSIGNSAFSGCSGLTSIVVEEGNTSYDSRNNCNAIIESSSNTLIAGCKNTVIPEDVTSIGDCAFRGCNGLTGITISKEVVSIGWGAFYECSGLTSIVVEEGNTSYDSRDNCNAIIESSSNTLIAGCKNTVIPEDVTSIGDSAFSYCSSLTSITIPNSVTSIGDDAFWSCSNLTSITIPPSVTSFGLFVFQECDKLIIYGEEGSYAQTYAMQNEIPFRPLGSQDIFTTEELEGLTEDNKTQDTVIETADGLTFTFKKGTMELVDGVDSYDFGAEITEDYDSLPDQDFAEEEFAFRIHFYHSGQLPGEAEITIPADSKWAGQKLYYYEIKEDGTYNYVCRSTVEEDGSYTVKQSHCSAYVATTKVPANLGNCDGNEGITSSDALAVLRHEVGIAQTNFDARFADCDGKEGITSSDALAILRYEVNVIDTLE